MASEAQVRANAANAQQSTGPRTEDGKAAASMNALKHGLRTTAVLLPEEDAESLAALHEELRQDLRPNGPMEALLFDRIVSAAWRLRRAYLVERGVFERVKGTYDPADTQPTFTQQLRRKFQYACESADALGKLSRYENSIERGMHRSLVELRRLQASRAGEGPAEKKLPNEPNSVVSPGAAGGSAAD